MLKPQRCLEMLAEQLAKGEARAWAQAVEAREPFELSVWPQSGGRVADTYLPTERAYGGSVVYRGIAGGLAAYACDPTAHGPVWVLSSATMDEAALQQCDGELWIDDAGQAYAQLDRSESSRVPLSFGVGLGACVKHLPLEAPTGSAKAFGDEATPTEIACWLRRFFGPHSPPGWMGSAANFSVEVPSAGFALLADIVVRNGTALRIAGMPAEARAMVVVGESELRVEAGAKLDLEGLTIANSTVSSALAVEGAATVARCTFVRCSTTLANLAMGAVVDANVPDGVRAFLASAGGAAFVAARGTMDVTASAFLDCCATRGMNIQGTGVFERCDFADMGECGDAIALAKPPRYWFDSSKSLIIRDCSFRSSSPGRALLPCWSDVLIRGSSFVNLAIEPCTDPAYAKLERGTLGIVNSTF